MTNKDLADLIFPNLEHDTEYYEKLYPERDLKENQYVTRFAPSPTGYMHIGNFMSVLIDYIIYKNSDGVFFLRNEDTDKAREIPDAIDKITHILNHYGLNPVEYEYKGKIVGNYGPYVQSERIDIYHAYIKKAIEMGRAYPCFCNKEELDEMRINQERKKQRTGYYGKYARCRFLSIDEMCNKIKNGEDYVIRFKSMGDFETKIPFDDEVKGRIEFPSNDEDFVIMKSSDKLPTYHFAHLVDDHLMHTTHVIRGEEWISSVPKHIELFDAFGFKRPKYIQYPLILKQDGDIKRKISKRKDPEASMSFYEENGYNTTAVIESVMTIINSNYEEWRRENKDLPFTDFKFQASKMSASGALFDLEKLNNISKDIISKMNAKDLCDESYKWACIYDKDFKELIDKDREYYTSILNIEREQEKPRKDIYNYKMIKSLIWYMYDDLFDKENKEYEWKNITDKEEIKDILNTYITEYYNDSDDKETWFNKIKEMCDSLGYASNIKEYKKNPEKFKGNVADISTVLRVALTTKSNTPDLYQIMKLLGSKKIEKRYNMFN